MSRPTQYVPIALCLRLSLRTIGFTTPTPPPPPPPPWAAKDVIMVSIALVDARKTSLTGVQNSPKKNRLAASRLVK